MILFNALCAITLWNLISSIFYLKNKPTKLTLYCGLIGYSGKKNFNKDKINLVMLCNSFERGRDSTGIYSPKNNLIKEADPAAKFLRAKPFEEDKFLIAHVRAKTIGANIAKNAHPFMEGNYVLAHNGTLKNHWALLRKNDLSYATHDVDSHVICSIINKEKNFNVLSEIDGAAALLINDTEKPDILYVFRNGERPLFKGLLDGGMYISSLKEPLELIGCKNIKEFKENYLYTIKDGMIQGTAKKIVNKPYSSPITPSTNTPVPINNWINRKYLGYNTPDAKDLFNIYLEFDRRNNYRFNDSDLTEGKEYLVLGVIPEENSVEVENDFGVRRKVNAYKFNRSDGYFTKDDYVKTRVKLVVTGNESKVAFEEETNGYIIKDYGNGTVNVLNLETNKKYDVLKSQLKRLDDLELEALGHNSVGDLFSNTNFLVQNPMIPQIPQSNNTDGDNELNFEEYYNRGEYEEESFKNEDDLEVESEEEEEDESFYDLNVNEEILINDLDNINIAAKDLVDYVTPLITSENLSTFKAKTIELDQTIGECLNKYHVTKIE